MKNLELAKILYEIADILEIQDVQWKPRAYRKAAQSIESLNEDIEIIYEKGRLKALDNIPGVGKGISKKIAEFIETGKIKEYEKLRKKFPVEFMKIPEVGPKTAKKLYEKLKIKNIKQLKEALKKHKLRKLYGFGEKKEKNILEGIKFYGSNKRFLLGYILPIARDIEGKLKTLKEVKKISISGSLRRMKETIRDIDILVSSNSSRKVIDFFTKLDNVKKIIAKGSTKSSVRLKDNIQVDIRVIPDKSFGSALQYFTGNKSHNIALRKIAIRKDLKLSEYGVFKGKKQVAGSTEEGVYKKLGLKYIEPELRTDGGEIQASLKGKLPNLVKYSDLKGDFHVHTNWSDGSSSIEEMAKSAKKFGYQYLGICDHAGRLKIATCLDEKRLLKQIKEIEKVNKKFSNFEILKGAEVDILSDGKLATSDKILKKLDIVSASIHFGFKKDNTDRILKALENKYLNIICHPTGRLINQRNPYKVDLRKVYKKAKENNKFLEINSYPNRLDLSDVNVKEAISENVKIAISTDSHNVNQLRFIELGIAVARRGWARKKDIVNTYNLKDIKKIL
ncbi:DNA polymerase III [archaeon]|nr:DNA polymerase III [archaeon]|tara:strand:+ start:1239 stop:2927 length:1689 start_codon:yes stop_codon:yes gene_type:complete